MNRWMHCIAVMSLLGMAAVSYGQTQAKLDYASQEKLGWQLACQAYTFGRNGINLFDTLDILNEVGIRYVEMFPGQKLSKDLDVPVGPGMSADAISALKAKLKATNVTAVAFGVTGIGKDEKGARALFDWAKEMGIGTIVAEPAADEFDVIEKLCKEYNIRVALHNHPYPSAYWAPNVVLDRTRNRSSLIGACADTGHWPRSQIVPVQALKMLEGRIAELHFKDLNRFGDGAYDVPWGVGVCNLNAMLSELKRQGFKGVFSIEYEIGSGDELKSNVAKCVVNFSDAVHEIAKN
ncbi:MAG TPA: sugar phosphate isomerase/epimerase [Tepidisphaeraceae bacterium]|nr:sugar phosphate isomerase/epimerase [Tepidisphaeraceae bacterium]